MSQHSDVTATGIAWVYKIPLPGFPLTHGLITLVNDNDVDNYLKEILAFVYHGSIVNNQQKNSITNKIEMKIWII